VAGFTVAHGKIVEIDLLMDRVRLRELYHRGTSC
jgi:hypothetical protein